MSAQSTRPDAIGSALQTSGAFSYHFQSRLEDSEAYTNTKEKQSGKVRCTVEGKSSTMRETLRVLRPENF